ncbi:MAG: VOC family protein [Pseudomonadota bacterium]
MIAFDHIAISGHTLEEAQAYVEEALGVSLQPGGKHDVFHTHNALLGLEDGLYLEAIAADPDAPLPDRPRWFDLDRFAGAPRLTNWICRTQTLEAALGKGPPGLGKPVHLSRGDLRWRMAVPEDGILPFDNCAPALIQWETEIHPVQLLKPSGIRLSALVVSHPQATALEQALADMLFDERVRFQVGPAGLRASFETPHGPREMAV